MVLLTKDERKRLKELASIERKKYAEAQHMKAYKAQVARVKAQHGRGALSGIIDVGEAKIKEFAAKKLAQMKAERDVRIAQERAADTPQRAAMEAAAKKAARDRAYNMLMGVSSGQVPVVTRKKGGGRRMMSEQEASDKAFTDLLR